MTTAEQIATGPYTVERHESAMSIAWTVIGPTDPHEWFRSEKAAQFECDRLNAAYTSGQQEARSVAHPPTSELVSAGNAMREQLAEYPCMNGGYIYTGSVANAGDPCPFCNRRARNIDAWDAALSAHPKEVAPTVESVMEVVDEWLWSCTPDNQHIRHPLGSKYRTDQPAQDALRSRLTKLMKP